MLIGLFPFCTDYSMPIDRLAVAAEQRGFNLNLRFCTTTEGRGYCKIQRYAGRESYSDGAPQRRSRYTVTVGPIRGMGVELTRSLGVQATIKEVKSNPHSAQSIFSLQWLDPAGIFLDLYSPGVR